MKSFGLVAASAFLLVSAAMAMDSAVNGAHANELASDVAGKDWAVVAAQKQ